MPKDTLELNREGLISIIPTTADGKIHRYTMPFNDKTATEYLKYTNEYQAQQMLADFKAIIAENPNAKIAITYSANEAQAEQLIAGYTHNTDQSNILAGGANQAEVFYKLIQLLNKEPQLKNQIHILPIATMPAGNGAQPASEASVKKCMANIAQHLGAGWTVLGLANQHTNPNSYAIGGGIATGWQNSKQKQLCDQTLQFITANPLTADPQPTDSVDIKDLKKAFVDGQQDANSLLIPVLDQIDPTFPPLTEPSVGVNSDFMGKITPQDWQQLFNPSFKPENNQEKINQGYKGTICENNEDLVHITDKGLICPVVENKQKQAEIIVQSLKLIKDKNNIPESQPLIVQANNFSAEDLEIIINELQKQKINIQFDITGEKDQNIINLIKTKGVLYHQNTPMPPATADTNAPILPALKQKAPKKKSEEEYELFDVPADGNCLFASIIHQLDTRRLNRDLNPLNIQSLREEIANYINEHWDGGTDGIIFKNFIREQEQQAAGINPPKNPQEFTAEDKEKYIAYINKDGTWGDEASIVAASKILDINIAIKTTQQRDQHNRTYPEPPNHEKNTIYLWHKLAESPKVKEGSPKVEGERPKVELHYLSCFAKSDPCKPKKPPSSKP